MRWVLRNTFSRPEEIQGTLLRRSFIPHIPGFSLKCFTAAQRAQLRDLSRQAQQNKSSASAISGEDIPRKMCRRSCGPLARSWKKCRSPPNLAWLFDDLCKNGMLFAFRFFCLMTTCFYAVQVKARHCFVAAPAQNPPRLLAMAGFYQGSENVLTYVKHFIASITPSLMPRPRDLSHPRKENFLCGNPALH